MVKEAEENAESDKLRKEEADTRNESEQIIFAAEKACKDLGDEVTADEKADIDAKIADLKKALEGNNLEDIKAKKDALMQASQNVAMKAYQKHAQQNGGNQGSSNDDGSVNADYEDVK